MFISFLWMVRKIPIMPLLTVLEMLGALVLGGLSAGLLI